MTPEQAIARAVKRRLPDAGPEVFELLGQTGAAGSRARRALTRDDPLVFALLYLGHHLRSKATKERITLSSVHLDWADRAKALMGPGPSREADIAPREMGKSTWNFLLIPTWAAAHGHVAFIAAFADSAEQAETHLATFKHELENNDLLRLDYPALCTPLTRGRGVVAADRVSLYRAESGFAFAARGMETRTLGLKIGSLRPDYILLDDIEPGEEKYSGDLAAKRLRTLQDTVLPLNDRAHVRLVGTVTMAGSIVHQLKKAGDGTVVEPWITEDGWSVHYFAPLISDEDGEEVSIWPERWSTKHLQAIRHTRAYLKNYANDPLGADGTYWTIDDFIHGRLEGVTRKLVSIDPAVTTKKSSDFTGIAVVGWRPPGAGSTGRGRCIVEKAVQAKLGGAAIRLLVLKILKDDPTIGLVLVEVNQGGDTWREILWGMPVPVKVVHQTVKKEVRAATVLNHYQRKRVVHVEGLTQLEEQQASFPLAPHDDMVDAAGTGVAYFLERKKRVKVSSGVANYA